MGETAKNQFISLTSYLDAIDDDWDSIIKKFFTMTHADTI